MSGLRNFQSHPHISLEEHTALQIEQSETQFLHDQLQKTIEQHQEKAPISE